jgi:hypothetical protein
MEQTAFERWLSGIGMLSDPQRRLAWRALALSEADATHDIEIFSYLLIPRFDRL